MSLLTKKKFSFTSTGMDKETFSVVSFKGFEAISKPYKFEILLVSENSSIDPLKVLQNPALFTIHRDEEDDVQFNGILTQFEETQEFNGYLFFRAVLAPKLWWLSLIHHNQVFLKQTAPEIMENALKDGGLNRGVDFSFNVMHNYQPIEYVCQYDESHFNFVSRWAEREGMYYFFEQTPTGEKAIFTDSRMEHKDLPLGKDLVYLPQSGLDALHTKEVVQSFICRHNMLPQRVYLKDYNYLKPSLAIEGIADVDEKGRGENYIYGVHFDSPEEGNRLAQIRAEALICRKSIFHGQSSVPFIVPGYTFDLNDHYKDAYNRKFLVSEVTHEGHQTGYLISGLNTAVEKRDEQMFYSNTFTAIYSDEQFRPEHVSEKPKISGTINAKIDAASSGEYAELDEHGRYKVILPFDRSGRFGGKASAFFRMMQPSSGQNQGMHFPLHKGTEVLLTFIDGNPDRPVIAGAIPNPETRSPVNAATQTKSIIRTHRTPQDPSTVGAAWNRNKLTREAKKNIKKDRSQDSAISDLREKDAAQADAIEELQDNFIEFDDGSGNERISIHSGGDLWLEAKSRYGDYHSGIPTDPAKHPGSGNYEGNVNLPAGYGLSQPHKSGNEEIPKRGDLLDKFGTDYNPTGLLSRHETSSGTATTQTFNAALKKSHVHVSSLDTVNTQEGNVYDFGGYWVYNLGNAYIENHMAQKRPDPLPVDSDFVEPTKPSNYDQLKEQDPNDPIVVKYDQDCETYKTNKKNNPDECHLNEHNKKQNDDEFPKLAKLNERGEIDLLKNGGPNWNKGALPGDNWGTILTTAQTGSTKCQGGSRMELWDTHSTEDTATNWRKKHAASGSFDEGWKNIWVEKKFGDSYSYTEGSSVSVVNGRSQTIIFDGREILEKYNGKGTAKKYYKKSGGGKTVEKKWNHKTGNLVSKTLVEVDGTVGENLSTTVDKYERSSAGRRVSHTWTKEEGGKGKHTVAQKFDYRTGAQAAYSAQFDDGTDLEKFGISYQHKNIADFNFGDQQSFYVKGSPLDLTANISLGIALSFNLKLAASFNFTFFEGGLDFKAYTSAGIDIKAYAAAKLSLGLYAGANLSLSLSDSISTDFKWGKAVDIKVDKRATGKIEFDEASGEFKVKVHGVELSKKGTLRIAKDNLYLNL